MPAHAQVGLDALDAKDPRRTPAAEIYGRWKDSVVFLSGAMTSTSGAAIDEFFKMPRDREIISTGSGFVVHKAGYMSPTPTAPSGWSSSASRSAMAAWPSPS